MGSILRPGIRHFSSTGVKAAGREHPATYEYRGYAVAMTLPIYQDMKHRLTLYARVRVEINR